MSDPIVTPTHMSLETLRKVATEIRERQRAAMLDKVAKMSQAQQERIKLENEIHRIRLNKPQ